MCLSVLTKCFRGKRNIFISFHGIRNSERLYVPHSPCSYLPRCSRCTYVHTYSGCMRESSRGDRFPWGLFSPNVEELFKSISTLYPILTGTYSNTSSPGRFRNFSSGKSMEWNLSVEFKYEYTSESRVRVD